MTDREEKILLTLAALADVEIEDYLASLTSAERTFAEALLYSDKYLDPEITKMLDTPAGDHLFGAGWTRIHTIQPEQLN
jgi:hypothetical protein